MAFSLITVLLAGCGDNSGQTADTVSTSAPTTSRASTTTSSLPATTTQTPTTTSTTIAVTTTTTEALPQALLQALPQALPQPLAPPEERADEPIIEIGTIEMPSLGVSKSLFEGVSLTVLDHGPGHWPGTAMPGQLGNVVIGGHRTSRDRPFRHIDQLAPGDEVILTTAEGRYVYQVTSTEVVTPDAIWIIDQTAAYTATLFACHPVGSTRQRIVVHLELNR